MIRHWRHFKGLIRHKWFVFLAIRKMGLPLWLAIMHDWSKFLPIEWFGYVENFYNPDGTKRGIRDKTGAYDPTQQKERFKLAWLHHQRNKHHWQAWIVIGDSGKLDRLPMPQMYLLEMIADWIGAGMSYSGKADPMSWYLANKHKMVLHPITKIQIEDRLRLIDFGKANLNEIGE